MIEPAVHAHELSGRDRMAIVVGTVTGRSGGSQSRATMMSGCGARNISDRGCSLRPTSQVQGLEQHLTSTCPTASC